MSIILGSARIDENGKIHGGRAGDQTTKEVMTQSYYKHSKGWRAFRCNDSEKAAKLASSMLSACNNSNIGYDQWQRNTLYNCAQNVNFDIARVTEKCETDCSALVRVCLCYAGFNCPDMNTESEPKVLQNLGLTEVSFTQSNGAGLKTGDIIVTKTKGHTCIVTSGETVTNTQNNANTSVQTGGLIVVELNELKQGSKGEQVKTVQRLLKARGYNLGVYGTDGDFGAKTNAAVRAFQSKWGLAVDGIVGKNTWSKLLKG